MPKFIDLTGKSFGRWTVLYRTDDIVTPSGVKRIAYHCKCECGTERDVLSGSLSKGQSKSCGCLQVEFAKSGKAKRTHGDTGSRLHRIWKNINTRTHNKNNAKYSRYGERGISICDEWSGKDGFSNFKNWAMQNGYADDLTIDRVNNDGDYAPDNCRWVSLKEQSLNKGNSRKANVNGIVLNVSQWADKCELSRPKLYAKSDAEVCEIIREVLNGNQKVKEQFS